MDILVIAERAAERLTDRHRDAERVRLLAHHPHPPIARRKLAGALRALTAALVRLERALDPHQRPLEA